MVSPRVHSQGRFYEIRASSCSAVEARSPPDDSLIPRFEIEGVFEGEIPDLVHGGLGRAVGEWRTAREAIGPFGRCARELVLGDDPVHEPDSQSLRRIDEVAQEQELERLRRTDEIAQEVRGATIRSETAAREASNSPMARGSSGS
jgi:hypothetical protein